MSTLSDFGLDRRLIPRKTVESLTYIYFEKDNRGIVLDISEGGLRFRVLSAIQETQPVHFWFSAEGQRFEADGEVKWMDEKKVTGGLRFNFLSLETREQIRKLMSRPSPALGMGGVTVTRKLLSAASAALEKLRSAVQNMKAPAFGVFARGMFSGLGVAGLVAIAILIRVDRSHFGEMLIEIGQRLAAKPAAPLVVQAPAPEEAPEVRLSSPPREISDAKQPVTAYHEPAVVIAGDSPVTSLPMTDTRHSPSLIPPPLVGNGPSDAPDNATENNEAPKLVSHNESTNEAEKTADAVVSTTYLASKYLDLREFRQKAAAEKTKDALGQAGFRASVSRRGHLWLSSYHVLVGPYVSDEEVETTRNELESRGFRPQSHDRLSRGFVLPRMITLADKDTVVKDCVISWGANSSAATVTFMFGHEVVMKAQGKWVSRGVIYKDDAVLSDSEGTGPRTLREIRYHGMNQALVLDGSKPIHFFIPSFRANR